ncbi:MULTISPECIES: DUF3606 domain-containing protein [Hydrocarboniphaga]|uniref:DUF3606 domain-containing protein n=1 Tax=Hydrocarboniphaga effusa AP103 TaxID=1172194 RepID=I8TDX7_9GAMM|nr:MULTISPECIES: DUF3606 domain-containing protein [Hydrocarboniphaga]EIT71903.1 hypothetical protein WQQ_20400 [Hydrocarboniphaga effusa AP103]MDZ4077394.1 DUF3606 domain-containing protein [Hydrocarboniphaga sp.]
MTDNPQLRNSPDSKRINVNEAHEVSYWTKALGVSERQLRDAVEKVGTSAEAVRKALAK